jgi:acyl-CoA reductase-like NAD-dependent aldehyde dehydrogenase
MTSSPVPAMFEQANQAIAQLQSRKATWLSVTIPERIAYLERCMDGVMRVADRWIQAACEAKGIDPKSSLAGEEWMAGVAMTLLNLRCLIKTLEAKGARSIQEISTRPNGQQVARVFPDNLLDRLLWLGFKGEVWLEPGKPVTQGSKLQASSGSVALVLGAGNIASTPPMDTLHKLFVENQVVLLKMNPVNEYLSAFLVEAFEPLIRDGFLQIMGGGADLGAYLCQHSGIDAVHITGSHHTHDAIVWGATPEERQHRKAINDPVLKKPITSELGCVTPILVVPGNWSTSDLAFQARQVASMVVHNASFNCVAAKVIVTAKAWHQREEFLAKVRQELAKVPVRKAYYPGAQQRYQAFLDRYEVEVMAERSPDVVPWTFIPNVPADEHEYALQTEAFCGILAEVSLDATTASEFFAQAVPFVNEKVWGNLSCTLLVDSNTQRQNARELDQAIERLQYGAISVNVWSGVIYALPDLPWGAFPGNSLHNICSGIGFDHNAYLLDHPQKSVLFAPFRIRPLPFWFANHRNLLNFAKRVAELQITPNWKAFLRVVFAALKA